ncbi:MAG TPA: hypothetical protein VFO12_00500 [Sphingomicrobium sp.]|nr:hypothetical protein [Sphingomicrobium sp.]
MNRVLIIAIALTASCSTPGPGPEPSLAPRAAEATDPRLPIPDVPPPGSVEPALASRLGELVASVRAAAPGFEASEAEASRLALAAGPMASESWIAAEQALSRLVAEYGATTRAAAEIDELAADRIDRRRWINPAEQEAIASAAAEVASISDRQAAAIDRLKNQLAR